MCFAPLWRALFRHLNFRKGPRMLFLYILTSKYSSRHKGVHFSTSQLPKSGPRIVCFVHFDVKMSFAPKRPLSTPTRGPLLCCFSILSWKYPSRHNGVHFFLAHLASWLRTRRFPYCRSLTSKFPSIKNNFIICVSILYFKNNRQFSDR